LKMIENQGSHWTIYENQWKSIKFHKN